MNEITVVLISAGHAKRMHPHTLNKPKCLLEISENKTILDYQINSLYKAGIKKIKMIVGYKMTMIKQYIEKANFPLNIDLIYNPFFKVSNNLPSLWLGLKNLKGEIITINGDNVFHFNIIKKLMVRKEKFVLKV